MKITEELLAAYGDRIRQGSVWMHRLGSRYRIVCLATVEVNLLPAVVYQCMATGMNWVRPLDEFLDGRFAPDGEPT